MFALRLKSFLPTIALGLALAGAPYAARGGATGEVRELELTLEDCLALALENNLELEVERLNPQIGLAGIQSAWGAFDPVLEVSANYDDSIRPRDVETTRAIGLATTSSQSQQYSASLGGELPTGTQWELSAGGNQDESSVNDFAPQVDANAGLTLTQPLLRGGGRGPNLANLRIARRDKLAADADLELQVGQLITDVYSAYYDLIFRRADLEAQRETYSLAEQLLTDNQERLRLGNINSLEVTQAQSERAARRAALFTAERTLHESQNILKRLIYRDLETRINQTLLPAQTPPPPTLVDPEINLGTALEMRADLRREALRLESQGIRVKLAQNELLPTLDLEGSYRALGQDDSFSGGFQNASELESREFTVGVLFRVPLGSRTERGELNAARLRREQQLLTLKALEQDVVVEVDNAVTAVRTSRLRYDAAREASQFARQTYVAEQDRLRAGSTTTFVVNQLQRDYTVARTNELSALADWRRSIAELSRVEGTALRANGIEIMDPPENRTKSAVAAERVDRKLTAKESAAAQPPPPSPAAAATRKKRAAPPIHKR